MRFEGNAPLYSAFAIVAIESVWPNPEGGELSSDAMDLELLGVGDDGYGSNTSQQRKGFARGQPSSGAFSKAQGYYKILPMNILSASTRTGLNGSNFEIRFTLDDILLVTGKDNAEAMSNATGLPLNRADLASLSTLPPMFSLNAVTDEELGLARYRISGANSSFNIEDLVTANDTVTIWLYHDPKEFYFKDEDLVTERLKPEESLAWVIGSGDRRGQYTTDEPTFKEHVLGVTGLIDEFMETSMQSAVSGEKPIKGVTRENLVDTLILFTQEARLGVATKDASDRVMRYAKATFGDTSGEYLYNWILWPLLRVDNLDENIGNTEETMIARKTALRNMVNTLTGGSGWELLNHDEANEKYEIPSMPGVSGSELVNGLNLFAAEMNNLLREYVSGTPKAVVTKSTQNFSNGRTIITSGRDKPFHGETPYLALKGQISSVKTTVGATQGTHTVTISGSGMEKVLNEHEVFHEDIYMQLAEAQFLSDYVTFYVNMSPARALLDLINRWATKKILFGEGSSAFIDTVNSLWYYLPGKEEDLPEGESEVEDSKPVAADRLPIRGNMIMANVINNNGDVITQVRDNMRIFTPMNYVDTKRIHEMISVIDLSYQSPESASVLNTTRHLNSRESVMTNAQRVVGAGRIYEVFVDETGRVRFRLTFEAMERTPQPLYTPIIQDTDLLADGATFERTDAELTTMVDIQPQTGTNNNVAAQFGLAYLGRSVPEADELPLDNIPDEAPPSSLSPDLFRYGLRSTKVDDIYVAETIEAKRKAVVYRGFFGQPLKKAQIKVRGSTSFRAGETVLVCLQKNKYRSRIPIDIEKTLQWLYYLAGHNDLVDMYVGADERLLHPEYYQKTIGFMPIPSEEYYRNGFVVNPKRFVLQKFIDTFIYLRDTLPGVNVITPDYFPSTYWYAQNAGLAFQGWDENSVKQKDTLDMYTSLLQASVGGVAGAADTMKNIYLKSPGVMNSVKFQDFRCTSYLIENVSHSFTQDSDMSTGLSLNYGQDNLVLLEPRSFLPIGFISLEKKMRMGWRSPDQLSLYTEFPGTQSPLQNMYVNQFSEDLQFKRGNFLYTAQSFRNISNYMYDIGVMEGLESTSVSDDTTVDVLNEVPQLPEDTSARVDEVLREYHRQGAAERSEQRGTQTVTE